MTQTCRLLAHSHVTVHLNEERKSSRTSRDLAGNRGTVQPPPNAPEAVPAGIFGDSEAAFIGTLGAGCSNTTDSCSDYPPGQVKTSIARDQTLMMCLLVGRSWSEYAVQRRSDPDFVVYDDEGNTYDLIAESPLRPSAVTSHG